MNQTEQMIQEMNRLFRLTGDQELLVPKECASELELLRTVKTEYKRRLLEKIPKYKLIPSEDLMPDMFLQALKKREAELQPRMAP